MAPWVTRDPLEHQGYIAWTYAMVRTADEVWNAAFQPLITCVSEAKGGGHGLLRHH